jgi:hypothetical protein
MSFYINNYPPPYFRNPVHLAEFSETLSSDLKKLDTTLNKNG